MIPGSRLRIIRYASFYHLAFGVSILVGVTLLGATLPEPFGSLQAYMGFMPVWAIATMFIVIGLCSRLAFRLAARFPWVAVALVVPQQMVLLWAVVGGVIYVIQSELWDLAFDLRTWLGICQISGLSYYHGLEVARIWEHAFTPKADEIGTSIDRRA
jgi:hypothetical protein